MAFYRLELEIPELLDRELQRWAADERRTPEAVLKRIMVEPLEVRLRQRLERTWQSVPEAKREILIQLRSNWGALTDAEKLALLSQMMT